MANASRIFPTPATMNTPIRAAVNEAPPTTSNAAPPTTINPAVPLANVSYYPTPIPLAAPFPAPFNPAPAMYSMPPIALPPTVTWQPCPLERRLHAERQRLHFLHAEMQRLQYLTDALAAGARTREALRRREAQGFASLRALRASMSTEQFPRCTRAHARRLPVDEECSVCYRDELMSSCARDRLVWCKNGCGRSVHKVCFLVWMRECVLHERAVTCVYCRRGWVDRCGC